MTWALLGHLLGVHPSAISVPGNAAIPLLRKHGITPRPGSPRITTSAQLLDHAAATGITITLHPPEPARHPQTTQPATRDTPETAN